MTKSTFIARLNAAITTLDLPEGMRVSFADDRAARFESATVSFVSAPDAGLTSDDFDDAQGALVDAFGIEQDDSGPVGEHLDARHGLQSGSYLLWDLSDLDDDSDEE